MKHGLNNTGLNLLNDIFTFIVKFQHRKIKFQTTRNVLG